MFNSLLELERHKNAQDRKTILGIVRAEAFTLTLRQAVALNMPI